MAVEQPSTEVGHRSYILYWRCQIIRSKACPRRAGNLLPLLASSTVAPGIDQAVRHNADGMTRAVRANFALWMRTHRGATGYRQACTRHVFINISHGNGVEFDDLSITFGHSCGLSSSWFDELSLPQAASALAALFGQADIPGISIRRCKFFGASPDFSRLVGGIYSIALARIQTDSWQLEVACQ